MIQTDKPLSEKEADSRRIRTVDYMILDKTTVHGASVHNE